MTDETAGKWIDCVVDDDYEIWNQYPFPIRRKGSNEVISESITKYGYVTCSLNQKHYMKHRIIGLQFIPNPNDLPCIDHINRNRTDNRLENLRWVRYKDNNINRTSIHGVEYEFVKEISDEAIELTDYNNHQFEFYYYVEEDDSFYFWNGIAYRRLHVNIAAKGAAYVFAKDTNEMNVKIYYSKFKKLYGID